MDIFAIIFALVMIAAAIAATLVIGTIGGIWAAIGFAAFLVVIYKIAVHQTGLDRPAKARELNAFQQSLSGD